MPIFIQNCSNTREVQIWRNDALGGTPSWTDINGDDSVMEWDEAGTDTAGDRLLFVGQVAKNTGETWDLSSLNISVLPGEIISVITDEAGIDATLIWQEDF